MLSRNQEHERMMQSIYSYLFYQKQNEEADVISIMESAFEMPYDEISMYSKTIIVKTLLNQSELDELISSKLSDKLSIDRINIVAHAILLLGLGEVRYENEVNKSIMINICVDLAKKYLDDGEYRFINAVLDNLL